MLTAIWRLFWCQFLVRSTLKPCIIYLRVKLCWIFAFYSQIKMVDEKLHFWHIMFYEFWIKDRNCDKKFITFTWIVLQLFGRSKSSRQISSGAFKLSTRLLVTFRHRWRRFPFWRRTRRFRRKRLLWVWKSTFLLPFTISRVLDLRKTQMEMVFFLHQGNTKPHIAKTELAED